MNFHQPPSTYVRELTLKVSQMERSLDFYERILGFKIVTRSANRAELGLSNRAVLLTLVQPEQVTPLQPRTTGLYHFAILLPSRAALAQVAIHLAKCGVRYGSSDHLVSEALYLSDPDGNGIELYRDRPDVEWSWHDEQVAMTVDPLNFEDLLASTTADSEWSGMPDGTIIGHIHLHIANIAQSEQFYSEGLHFEAVCRYGTQALFLSTGKYHHHIGVNTWQGVGAPPPLASSVGLAHFTLAYPDEGARQSVLEDLSRLGASVLENEEGYQTVDPAGNVIQIGVHLEGR